MDNIANQLGAIRQIRPDMAGVNYSMLQAICRGTRWAYDSYFPRLRPGAKPGRPRVKSYLPCNSITFLSYGDRCKLTSNRLYIQAVGTLKIKLHRPVGGPIKAVTFKRVGRRWYVVVVCKEP